MSYLIAITVLLLVVFMAFSTFIRQLKDRETFAFLGVCLAVLLASWLLGHVGSP